MKKLIFTALAICSLLTASTAFAYTSPGSPHGLVNDFANVLSPAARQELENTLRSYEQSSGSQITVVTINELKDETIETYAVRLFAEWGIGQKGRDNGALFLISKNDRQMRIEVGYGLEGDLTDIEAKQIISNVVAPYFKQNNFDEGVKQGVAAIIQAIGSQGTGAAPVKKSSSHIDWGNIIWFGLFVLIALGSILSRSRSWWAGGVLGVIIGAIIGFVSSHWLWLPILIIFGFSFDYLVSRRLQKFFQRKGGRSGFWFFGGPWGGGGSGGGGWGGFGGGSSGGGGASGRW